MPFRAPKAREPLDAAALYEYAVRALGRRMRTEAELRRLMRTRVEPGEAGDVKMSAVIVRLKEQRYLDDNAFAHDYSRLRQEGAKFGRRRVAQDLQVKGVASETAATALENVYGEVNEEELARQYVERKRLRKPEDDKASARIMRQLVRAGFSLGTVYKLLRKWDVSEDLLTEMDSLDEG